MTRILGSNSLIARQWPKKNPLYQHKNLQNNTNTPNLRPCMSTHRHDQEPIQMTKSLKL